MPAEQLIYPQAYIAMDGGDLVQVTNFTVNFTNGAKQKHTLRRPGAGIVFAPPETTVSFDSIIDEDGMERDYYREAEKKRIKQIRAKLPGGKTLVINGAFKDVNLDGPIDDATKVSCTFVGKKDPS